MGKFIVDKQKAYEMLLEGSSGQDVAEYFGVSRQAISGALKSLGTSISKIKQEIRLRQEADMIEQMKLGHKKQHLLPQYSHLNKANTKHIPCQAAAAPEGTKWCNYCKAHQPLDTFVDLKGSYCGPCSREYRREQSRKNILQALEWDGRDYACEVCGFDVPEAIDFHHRDPETKEHRTIRNNSAKIIYEELKKCDVLCANHHKIHHHEEGNWDSGRKELALSMHPDEPKCSDCGETDIRVLEFDHVRGVKNFNIISKIGKNFRKKTQDTRYYLSGLSEEEFIEELEKCDIRCRNCHRIKTWDRVDEY